MKASEFFGGYLNKDLPGISDGNGFKGGTAMILGEQTGDTVDAISFFTDYRENVVLGGVTKDPNYNYANPPAGSVPDLYVSGMKIIPLPRKDEAGADPRFPGLPFQNGYGFEVEKELPLGSLTAVEGYLDQSGAMRAFLVETDLGTLVRAGQNEVSVLRAQWAPAVVDQYRVVGQRQRTRDRAEWIAAHEVHARVVDAGGDGMHL